MRLLIEYSNAETFKQIIKNLTTINNFHNTNRYNVVFFFS